MKKFFKILLSVFVISLALVSCASSGSSTKAKLTKTSSRAFWRIDGVDAQGNPSTVYIQGTFHLGDERIFPLSEEVQNAFINADRHAGEMSTQSYADFAAYGPVLNAPNKDGKIITDYLTDEENEYLKSVFGENLSIVVVLDPWQITNAMGLLPYINTGLSSEYGLDNTFITALSQNGLSWEGLDTVETQINVLTFGDYDTQIAMAKDAIKVMIDEKTNESTVKSTVDLYEAYVADNMKKMTKLLKSDIPADAPAYYKEYSEMLWDNRNKDWAEDIANYLAQGGTTFIFAGCGHWLGDSSVFEYMKKNGTLK